VDIICPKSGRDFSSVETLRDCLKSCENTRICRYAKRAAKIRSVKDDERWLMLIQGAFGVTRATGNTTTSKPNYKDARCPECGSNAFYTNLNTKAARCSNCGTIFEIPDKRQV
jgi:DNA-directed RNA polymerase subunit RPC12/RpoP